MEHVTIEQAPRMNLLGLMLGQLLERNLARPELAARAAKIAGSVAVQVGEMGVTLGFDQGRVTVTRGAREGATARVSGAMPDLLALALGGPGGGLLGLWLSGRLRTRGSLLLLLKLKPLLQADPPAAQAGAGGEQK